MTQPTIEQMVGWLHPFCKLDEQPSQSDLTAANMASAIIAALTAQAGVTELLDYLKVRERDVFGKNVLVMEIGGNIILPGNSYEAAAFNTLSGLLAAIAAAKDGA